MITPPLRPRDEDAERGLLSSLLRDDCMAIALDEGVTESTFNDPLHLEIWKCMVTLDRDKEPVDEISVLQVLGSEVDRLGKENVWCVFNACETSGHATRLPSRQERRSADASCKPLPSNCWIAWNRMLAPRTWWSSRTGRCSPCTLKPTG